MKSLLIKNLTRTLLALGLSAVTAPPIFAGVSLNTIDPVARVSESGRQIAVTRPIACAASGDLAYTVAIERSEVRLVGQEKSAAMALRVAHIFRKEGGEWKLVLRHADPLMDKAPPAAVLQK